ncbi:MAG: bifunctional (p)ppGpp synthetase/guanosine-3',5'-bis(diphosphate) 3'-pyrophosphohydrolase [Synechococcales cyanobacterium]
MTVAVDISALDCEIPDWLAAYLEPCPHPVAGSRIHTPQEITLITSAFLFAHDLHRGQKRKSGEPYIGHPVQVASLLRDLWADGATIAAGFLHDVVEDTQVTAEDIEQRFGPEVRHLVEGVTKLSKFSLASKTAQQAENFRRMFVAMAKDIRVIVVKLADRLHNMRTLEFLPEEKQKRIASETMAFFAPLASRLGIWTVKWELEDLCFKYLDPAAYTKISQLVTTQRQERESQVQSFMDCLGKKLEKSGLSDFELTGRPKHLFSIYSKMRKQEKSFQDIYDLYAVRIILHHAEDIESETHAKHECYHALALVHEAFPLVMGRFKDYISVPKPNGYQSIHTTVMVPSGSPMEVQIRTQAMHQVAEYGIAAHWKYKEAGNAAPLNSDEKRFMWLRQLVEWQNHLQDDKEYLETIHQDLYESFESDVYVFTPRGDVHCLPKGACVVDFAYRIHTDVGNHCAGAIVNHKMVPFHTVLRNGDIVEILTQKNAHPSMDWINFVQTNAARNRIRQWYKRSHRSENISRGRQFLEREMGKNGLEAILKSDRMKEIVKLFNFTQIDDLLASLGQGETTVNSVVNKIQESVGRQLLEKEMGKSGLDIFLKSDRMKDILEQFNFKKIDDLMASLGRREMTVNSVVNKFQEPATKPTTPILTSPGKSPANPAKSGGFIQELKGLKHRVARCCCPLPGDEVFGVVTRFDPGIAIHRRDCSNVLKVEPDRLMPYNWNPSQSSDRPITYPVDLHLKVIDRMGVYSDILARIKDAGINISQSSVSTKANEFAPIHLCVDIKDREQLTHLAKQLEQMSDVVELRSPYLPRVIPREPVKVAKS